MTPAIPPPPLAADPSPRQMGGRPVPWAAASEPRPEAPAALASAESRLEGVRMDLLVARARDARF